MSHQINHKHVGKKASRDFSLSLEMSLQSGLDFHQTLRFELSCNGISQLHNFQLCFL